MKKIVFVVLMVIISFFALLYFSQEKFIFHPCHDLEAYAVLSSDSRLEAVDIDGLTGWMMHNVDGNAPIVVFFGGNAQNSSATFQYYLENDIFTYYEGYNVLMVDYSGFGTSTGKIKNEKNFFEAALKVYDYAKTRATDIVVMGYSIGTGPATYVASQREVKGLILLAPYDRLTSLYNSTIPVFYGPMELLVKYKFDSLLYSENVKVNPLIIASKTDEVINYKLSTNLARTFDCELVSLDGVPHNYISTDTVTLEKIHEYLGQGGVVE